MVLLKNLAILFIGGDGEVLQHRTAETRMGSNSTPPVTDSDWLTVFCLAKLQTETTVGVSKGRV